MSEHTEIVVNVRYVIEPATLDVVRDALLTMQSASRAEDGCQDYTFSEELDTPGALRITERWDSIEHLRAHFATDHMAVFRAVMADNPPLERRASFFEVEEFDPSA